MSATTSLRCYAPEQGSTAWKVIEFLTTNPDEALTPADVEAKFEKPRSQVHSILAKAISVGVLVREEDLTSGELIYRLGAGHPDVKPNPGGNPCLARSAVSLSKAPAPNAKAKRYRIVLDVSEIVLEPDVPLPAIPTSGGRRSTDWPALFARMQPGDSAQLPAKVKATLGKAISRQHKEHEGTEFATRAVDADHIRLWRVK